MQPEAHVRVKLGLLVREAKFHPQASLGQSVVQFKGNPERIGVRRNPTDRHSIHQRPIRRVGRIKHKMPQESMIASADKRAAVRRLFLPKTV
jgi:hypothetical protein